MQGGNVVFPFMAKRRRLANRCLRLLVFLLCCLAADFHHLHLPLTKQHTAHKFNDYLYSAQQAGNIAQQRIKCVRISAQHGCYRVAERIEYFYADITGDTPNQKQKGRNRTQAPTDSALHFFVREQHQNNRYDQ